MAMRWQWARPTTRRIDNLQERLASAPISYSNAELKAFTHRRDEQIVGRAEQFGRARNRLLAREHLCVPGLVCSPRTVEVGAVLYGVSVGPVWGLAGCRILRIVDESTRCSVAYGTLSMHGVRGEERFEVRIDKEDLVFVIEKWFSVPLRGSLFPSTLRRLQGRFVDSVMDGMRADLG